MVSKTTELWDGERAAKMAEEVAVEMVAEMVGVWYKRETEM